MFKYIVLLALVPAVVLATEGTSACRNGMAQPTYINVAGCEKAPCDIPNKSTARMVVGFTAPTPIETFTPVVNAGAIGVWVPYSLPDDVQVGCDFLNNSRCPISEGEEVEYEFLFTLGTYPTISVDIELTLKGDQGEILCVTVPIKVSKAIE